MRREHICNTFFKGKEEECPVHGKHTEPEVSGDLREIFLANFCDGDSWEAANAASFTKHGALAIANFFYHEGLTEALTLLPEEKHEHGDSESDVDMQSGWNQAVEESREAIKSKITSIREES